MRIIWLRYFPVFVIFFPGNQTIPAPTKNSNKIKRWKNSSQVPNGRILNDWNLLLKYYLRDLLRQNQDSSQYQEPAMIWSRIRRIRN